MTLLDLTRSFRDPIHGTVRLTQEEVAVIDHPLFLRLQHIRQNGLLYYVFPSATHTRFEHSVGVLYIADAILRHLLINSRTAAGKHPPAVLKGSVEPDKAFNFNSVPSELLRSIFRHTRLAALVHDLGHGPFSHTFDAFAPKMQAIKSLQGAPDASGFAEALFANQDGSNTSSSPSASEDKKRVEHEDMSCILFSAIWREVGGDPHVPFDVAAAIRGKPDLCRTEELRPFVPLMHDVVASAPADADRMDYLERDSRSIGVNYGLFDRNRVLSSFLCYADQGPGGAIQYRLGVKQSGMRAVENLVQARFEMFAQIYFHKTNRAASLMLDEIATQAKNADVELFGWTTWDDLFEGYLELSDERFLRALRGLEKDLPMSHSRIIQIADQLAKRRLWKRVFEGEAKSAKHVYDMLEKECPKELLVIDKADPKPTKEVKTGATLLYRGRDGVYAMIKDKTWFSSSRLIMALAARSTAVERIYYKVYDSHAAAELRTRVWKLIN